MYKIEKRTDSSKRFRISLSKVEDNEQEELYRATIKLTSRDELIIMHLHSNTGYYLECFPCVNLLGTFGNVDGMICLRVEQPVELSDQVLYFHAMQKHFAPTLSYLVHSRIKVQLNGYAYGRSFYVTDLHAVDRADNPSGTSLLSSVQ